MKYVVPVVIVVGVLVYVASCWGRYSRRFGQRSRSLAEREAMSSAAWFSTYLPVSNPDVEALSELMGFLGAEIGVDWTVLRPGDRFSTTLRLPGKRGEDDSLEGFNTRLEQWMVEREISISRDELPDEIGEFLLAMSQGMIKERDEGA